MANRFLCGFDDYATALLGYEWTRVENTVTIEAGMTGFCARLDGTSSEGLCGRLTKTAMAEGQASGVVGFRFRYAAAPPSASCFFAGGDSVNTHLVLALNTDGTISICRSAQTAGNFNFALSMVELARGAVVLAPNISYYLELTFTIADGAGGAAALYINGSATPAATVSGADTRNGSTAAVTFVGWAAPVSAGGGEDAWLDDVYVNDATGAVNDGIEGDVQVDSHYPTSPAGAHSEWTRSTGADQWATVDETPASVADYNSTPTPGAIDTLTIEHFKNAGADILAVQVTLLAQKTDSGTAAIAPVVRINASDDVGADQYPSVAWEYLRQNYDAQPDASAWNETDFNAMEVGYQKTA